MAHWIGGVLHSADLFHFFSSRHSQPRTPHDFMPTFVVYTPAHRVDPHLAIAAMRAGELGVLDLGYVDDPARQRAAVRQLSHDAARFTGSWGLRWDTLGEALRTPHGLTRLVDGRVPYLILAGVTGTERELATVLEQARTFADHVWLEVHHVQQGQDAQAAGFDGLVLCGHEAGGFVSSDSSFLLLQQFANQVNIPYWLRGGVGLDTAGAALAAGATGVVLSEQMWLAAESPFDTTERAAWRQFDGSETATLSVGAQSFRCLCRADRSAVHALETIAANGGDLRAAIAEQLRSSRGQPGELVPLAQDIAHAAKLAARGLTVADILSVIRRQIAASFKIAGEKPALVVDGPLAQRLGTRYPILQGPMTRVSDTAEFAQAVAENGALPFLALAVMSGGESRTLLTAAKRMLGERSWGVGVLGFLPGEMREAQDAAIFDTLPPFAIIAGGRPSQAAQFEKRGIKTFLHVPSPGLLESFIAEGARKFIFEGRECGGHVGPRTSFVLWQQQIQVLLDARVDDPSEFEIVFAGGVHDGLSAAMVSVLAARLTERGMNVGVLLGTGYLFTHEAVRCGAITAEFQRQAIECRDTVLLESGVGHATRCARTPFAAEFQQHKDELLRAGKTSDEIRLDLELLNIGRLRIASKGQVRQSTPGGDTPKGEIVQVDADEQRRTGMYMIGQLAALRDRAVSMSELHADLVAGCTQHLRQLTSADSPISSPAHFAPRSTAHPDEPIAIVGMAGMFPKAGDMRRFWANILARLDAVTEVSPERWDPAVNFHTDRLARDTVYSKWGGFLDEVKFDPFKWRIPPASLRSIEPVQLLSLEVAWEAFRDAGYDHRPFPRERTSVIFGIAGPHDVGLEYSFRTMAPHFLSRTPDIAPETVDALLKDLRSELVEWTEDSFPGFLSNVVAGRIANRLDLGGTNLTVDAACAASLAALHTGIAQLRLGWSDVVLLGTADTTNNLFTFQCFSKTHALSPRGRSRPFDDSADGIALGEAIAAVVLKRLCDAERDGDQIYAVIRGIGSSSDGNNRSLTAPHPPGQVLAVQRAYADAQIDPGTVSLVEAHGTGTAVGDRSEIQSMVTAFAGAQNKKQAVAVGSIKSMIGHTKTAAGVVGLVKTALALKHRVLPPTIGVEKPNQAVDFSHSPFYVNSDVRPWFHELGDHPRRAGVSAFGFGGTNFHVVLEEYTRSNRTAGLTDLTPRPVEVFCWRRGTRDELLRDLRQVQQQLTKQTPADLTAYAAASWALERRRTKPDAMCRLAMVASSGDDLLAKVNKALDKLTSDSSFTDPAGIYYSNQPPLDTSAVAFLYPGQGSQAVGMLRDLLVVSSWGSELFTRWNRLLEPQLGDTLTRLIYPPPAFTDDERRAQQQAINDTRVAQPALGAVEVFATQLLSRFNLRPAFAGGHSYGEYVALYAAHCLDADELLSTSVVRGRVSAEAVATSPGAMAAVQAGPAELQKLIDELRLDVLIANRNSPQQSVIAGQAAAIDAAVQALKQHGLRATRLAVSAPFHTPALATGAAALGTQLQMVSFREPLCAVYSNTTGDRYPTEPSAIRQLLQRHLIEPVQFDRQIAQMYADGARLFVEVGPGRALSGLVGQILVDQPHSTLSLDAAGRDGVTQFAHLLAATIGQGLPVRLDAWYAGRVAEEQTPAEVLRAEAAAREIKPSDWYVGPGGVRPCKAPTSNKTATVREAVAPTPTLAPVTPAPATSATTAPAPSTPPAASPAASPPASPARPAPRPAFHTTPQLPSSAVSAMNPQPLQQEVPVTSQPSLMGTASSSAPLAPQAAAQVQSMLGQWMALQREQVQLNDRFLRIQERILFGGEGDASLPQPELHEVRELPAIAPPAPVQRTAPQPVATPSPVKMTPVAAPRPAITIPARAVEAPSETRLLRAAQPVAPAPAAPAPAKSAVAATPSANGNSHVGNGHAAKNGHAASNGQAHVAAQAAVPANAGPPPTEQFREDLLNAVSERTGYPIEMLDEDLPLEAGLGIDSIKTVEVFSKLKPYHAFFQRPDQDEEAMLKAFTRLKTLRDIVNFYDEQAQLFNGRSESTASSASSTVNRFELEAVEAGEAGDEKKKHLSTTSS